MRTAQNILNLVFPAQQMEVQRMIQTYVYPYVLCKFQSLNAWLPQASYQFFVSIQVGGNTDLKWARVSLDLAFSAAPRLL